MSNPIPDPEHAFSSPSWREENLALSRLAFPTLLSTLSVPLVTVANTIMVGHLPGAWPLAAVAMGGVAYGVMVTVLSPFRGLSIGLTGQWFGRGEPDLATDWTLWGLVIALVAGGGLALAGPWLGGFALRFFQAEGLLREAFLTYVTIRFWELPFVVAQMFLLGHLRGWQRAWLPMAVTVVVGTATVALSWGLIYGLGWGVAGAAWGAVGANAIGGAVALVGWMAAVRPGTNVTRWWTNRRLLTGMRGVFGWGVARSMLLMGTLAAFTAAASHLGATEVAAHAVLMELWLLSSYAVDGFACGMEGLVAKRWGEGDQTRLRIDAWVGLAWCVGVGLLFSLLFGLAGERIAAAFSGEADVVRTAVGAMVTVVLLQPVVAVAYWADGVLTGVVNLRAGFMTLLAGVVVCALVLPWSRHQGLSGVWQGVAAFSLARAAWALWECRGHLRA
jgi:MATE family multidrug resistance protein